MMLELIETDVEETEENGTSISSNNVTSTTSVITTSAPITTSCITNVTSTLSSLPTTVVTSLPSCLPPVNVMSSSSTTTNGEEDEVAPSSLCMHPVIPPAVIEIERWSDYVERYVTSMASEVSNLIIMRSALFSL